MYCKILINGVVQGIGFRPFVYNIAMKLNLKGYVLNKGDAGVEILVNGNKKQIEDFILCLKNEKPALARYESFYVDYRTKVNQENKYSKFLIEDSSLLRASEGSYIPPDLPICSKCLSDMKNDYRRLNYPFTSCVECGPRFTVITSLPYDRPRTVMNEFPLCPECLSEYTQPTDRRFHAQTTCCWNCGPNYLLVNKNGEVIISKDEFKDKWFDIVKILDENKIIAIKGIGGTHLACGTMEDDPIHRLRAWKGSRGDKPFAVMAHDLTRIEKFAEYNQIESEFLQSLARPIVLLEKSPDYPLSSLISPKLHNIGVLLPYSGIHHLITEKITDPAIIMTSGNPSNTPILIENDKIIKNLSSVADYFLLHDRKIHQRADDSVLRIHLSNNFFYPVIIRRSRGYVPEPIKLTWKVRPPTVLGLGAEMYNVGAFGFGERCFPTQHIGHMTTMENIDFFKETIDHMKNLIGIKNLEGIGSDLHPQFQTTDLGKQFAEEMEIPFFQFQHHFAHLGALALDAKINPGEDIICVALDGTGYGEDQNIWGGEILLGNYSEYKRMAHLENQILLGGDQAIRHPSRILLASLLTLIPPDQLTQTLEQIPWLSWIIKSPDYQLITKHLTRIISNKNFKDTQLTSSCGRLLDSLSVLLGASRTRTYEGEPAIKLEALAEQSYTKKTTPELTLDTKVNSDGTMEILTSSMYSGILELIKNNRNRSEIALSAEITIARKFAEIASDIAQKKGISKIGLSGGVCYNRVIFTEFYKYLADIGDEFCIIKHNLIPCGDGGIAIGQVPLIQAQLM